MSEFLGPIHYWLYNKICIQEAISCKIIETLNRDQQGIVDESIKKNGFEDFTCQIKNSNLEMIIDESNIHGWLQEMVSNVENKYAMIVSLVLEKDWLSTEKLKEILFECGKNIGKSKAIVNPEQGYKLINDTLLDGMPCDHINNIVSSNTNELIYQHTGCIHEQYWKIYGQDVSIYYSLRESFIEGMLLTSPVSFKKICNNEYSLFMNGITVLMAEHQNIIRMTKVMRTACYKLLKGERADYDDFALMIEFIRGYADKHHHGKEEKILFDEMLKHLGKIGENLIRHGMLVEHDLGRLHVKELEEALAGLKNGDDECKLDVIANAISYTHLIIRHINKEDDLIYKYGEKNLSQETLTFVDQATMEFEEDANQNKIQDKYQNILIQLEKKYCDGV